MKENQLKQLSTLGDWLHYAADAFGAADLYYGHGTDNAWDEAVQLVLQGLNLDIHSDGQILTQVPSLVEKQKLAKLIEQRIQERKPLAYLTQTAWFMDMPFYVDERVLIPRSPLGEWIARAFDPWLVQTPKRICDMGSGSGCLAIACAKIFPEAEVDAIDISQEALQVAKMNVERHQVGNRVHLHQSDCFDHLANQTYDLIISNPPYVSHVEMNTLPAEYVHEPRIALEAEEKGLSIVLKILRQASRHLDPQGVLVMDVGYSDETLMRRLPQAPFIWLDLKQGGQGIFLLTAEDLHNLNLA